VIKSLAPAGYRIYTCKDTYRQRRRYDGRSPSVELESERGPEPEPFVQPSHSLHDPPLLPGIRSTGLDLAPARILSSSLSLAPPEPGSLFTLLFPPLAALNPATSARCASSAIFNRPSNSLFSLSIFSSLLRSKSASTGVFPDSGSIPAFRWPSEYVPTTMAQMVRPWVTTRTRSQLLNERDSPRRILTMATTRAAVVASAPSKELLFVV